MNDLHSKLDCMMMKSEVDTYEGRHHQNHHQYQGEDQVGYRHLLPGSDWLLHTVVLEGA